MSPLNLIMVNLALAIIISIGSTYINNQGTKRLVESTSLVLYERTQKDIERSDVVMRDWCEVQVPVAVSLYNAEQAKKLRPIDIIAGNPPERKEVPVE